MFLGRRLNQRHLLNRVFKIKKLASGQSNWQTDSSERNKMKNFEFECYAGTERKTITVLAKFEWQAKIQARGLALRAGWSLIERGEFDSE